MKVLIGCPRSRVLAKKLAKKTNIPYSELKVSQFPDGELLVKYSVDLAKKHVILVSSMYPNPTEALLELHFAIQTAKDLRARRITVITPYLGFMRQDKRFHSGESVSNKIMADLLGSANKIITIDPHLHRVHHMSELFGKSGK